MESDQFVTIVIRLFGAMLAGALVGLERTYHGRPAGFRTHTLVATASSLLILFTVFFQDAISNLPIEAVRLDPTRLAQGIMTGIGFLGAGVIIKEGLTVRGLTTAASIWMTASIGIMIGAGMYFAAIMAEIIALGTLGVFNVVESRLPTLTYGRLMVRFLRDSIMPEENLSSMISEHEITSTNPSYHMDSDFFEYEFTIRTKDLGHFKDLTNTLRTLEEIKEFRISTPDN